MNRKIVFTVFVLVMVLGGGALGFGPHPPPIASDGRPLHFPNQWDPEMKILWERTYDTGYRYAQSIIRSSEGGYLVACIIGSLTNQKGIYLLRVDGEGKKIWEREYPLSEMISDMNGTDRGGAYDVVESFDGGYVVTGFTRSLYTGHLDLYLLKVDREGEKVWEKIYGGPGAEWGNSIVRSGDGGFVIAGWMTRTGHDRDVCVLKVDSEGEKVWERSFGGEGRDEACSIVRSGDGGFVVAGLKWEDGVMSGDLYVLKVDGDGNRVWERSFGGERWDRAWCVVQSGDGGFVVAGETDVFVPEEDCFRYQIYLLKIDRDGNNVWEKIHRIPYKAFSSSSAYRIIQAGDGGFMVTGRSGLALLVLRIDSHGEIVWETVYEEGDGAELSTRFDLVRSCDGGFVLAGGSKPTGYTYPLDVYLFKITEAEEAEFSYVSQSFECVLCDPRAGIPTPASLVAHVATLKCTQGYLDRVNLTIPYGDQEITTASIKVLTTAEKSLDKEIHQTRNETTVSIRLPRVLGPGQDFVLILRYRIWDLSGDSGISRPVKTGFLEGLLGGGERFEVTYKPGIFEDALEQLGVTVYAPIGYVPKTFEPVSYGYTSPKLSPNPLAYPPPTICYDRWTGRVGLHWNLTWTIHKAPEFRAVFGKPSLMQSHPGLVILGIMAPFVVCGLILVLRKVKYLSPTKLTEDGEEE